MKNETKPIHTSISLRSLFIAVVCSAVMLYFGKDSYWTTIVVLIVVWYPLLCYALVIAKFYDDYIIVIRPLTLIHRKKIIYYNQISYMRVPSKYFSMDVMALLIYIKERTRPLELPLPFITKKQQDLAKFIESKGIDFKWD